MYVTDVAYLATPRNTNTAKDAWPRLRSGNKNAKQAGIKTTLSAADTLHTLWFDLK